MNFPKLSHFLLCGLCIFSFHLRAESSLRLASDPWPPFTGTSDQPRVVLDLVDEALRRSGVNSETVILEPGILSDNLEAGAFQGSPAQWKTAKREKYMLFSDPILENRLLLVGRKGSDVDVRSFRDLKESKVGIVDGYGYGPELMSSGIILVPGRDHQENLSRLLAEEVDFILVNELMIHYAVLHQKTALDEKISYGDTPLLRRTLHFALRKDTPKAKEIIAGFNRELKKMMIDGSYQRLLQLPWVEMDTDGDGVPELVYHGDRAGSEKPIRRYQPFISEEESAQAEMRYNIQGVLYPSWDEIPSSLKDSTQAEARGVLVEFKF